MTIQSRAKDLAWSSYVWPKGRLGNRLQGAVIGGIESRRVRREWQGASRILLVHTPGKVGSKAMVAGLEASRRPGDTIFHTHRINPDNTDGLELERATLAPRRTWYTTDFLGEHLRMQHDKDVVVLAAVRDPIERSLSAFLQNAERYVENGRPITALSRLDADDLTRQFTEYLAERYDTITEWVEVELNAMFDVDIFQAPFDHAAGYQIEGHDRVRLGVIRHDRFADALTPFIHRLSDLDPPTIGRINDSSGKAYGSVYREMRDTMRLPALLVTQVYDTRYAKHFFTDMERDRAVDRWSSRSIEPVRVEASSRAPVVLA